VKPFEIRQTPDHTMLLVRGEITIQNAQECLKVFRDVHDSSRLMLDLEGVTGADISFLQMICSLHRTCMKSGCHLTLTGNPSEAFKTVLELSGYRRKHACQMDESYSCLWLGEDRQ